MKHFFSRKLPATPETRMAALAEMGFAPVVFQTQVHGSVVVEITDPNQCELFECDGMVTRTRDLWLAVKTADCVPVLLHDPVRQAAAAIHAGWRGTAAGVVTVAVTRLIELYGTNPADVRAFIGPRVCGGCYEVSFNVARQVGFECCVPLGGGKFKADLGRANALRLKNAGVNNIEISPVCTYENSERYWSHRAHKSDRGVQFNLICL